MSASHSSYIIAGGAEGKKRLDLLSRLLAASTTAFLESAGKPEGKRILDLGCGGGSNTLILAGLVGHSGQVTGVDFDASIIGLAAEEARAKGVENIAYQVKDAHEIDFQNVFDIAYARFLLSHNQDPPVILRKMMESVVPGGWVMVEDVDFSGHFSYPSCAAFDQYLDFYTRAAAMKGFNANLGQELVQLFHAEGLSDIHFNITQPCYREGEGKWMAVYTLEKIRDSVIAQGLATADQISEVLAELEAFTQDPDTIISLPRIFQVRGRRPSLRGGTTKQSATQAG